MNTPIQTRLTAIFVLAWIWIASFVFQNIFAGVMVNNFHNIRSEMYLKEDNSKLDQQVTYDYYNANKIKLFKCIQFQS